MNIWELHMFPVPPPPPFVGFSHPNHQERITKQKSVMREVTDLFKPLDAAYSQLDITNRLASLRLALNQGKFDTVSMLSQSLNHDFNQLMIAFKNAQEISKKTLSNEPFYLDQHEIRMQNLEKINGLVLKCETLLKDYANMAEPDLAMKIDNGLQKLAEMRLKLDSVNKTPSRPKP